MTDWQSYLDIVREEEDTPLSPSRLLTTTTTTAATQTETGAPTSSPAGADAPALDAEKAAHRTPHEQNEQNAIRLPERAEPPNKARAKREQSPRPAADVAGEWAAPAADVASGRPASGGTGTSRLEAGGTSGTRLPANWQEIDPHAYQPRPFGPMETDADWPGEDEEGEEATPLPAVDAGGEGPKPQPPANKFAPHGLRPPSPPARTPPTSTEEHISQMPANEVGAWPVGDGGTRAGTGARATNGSESAGTRFPQAPVAGGRFGGGTLIGANSFAGGRGEPFADLEERCWLCEEEAELYDPSGQGWCFLCLEVAGKTEGWQDLVDLLPAAWRRKEEHQQLAVFAAAHYHQAGRREIALRWSQPPFHQRLKGADLFRTFARWLAAPERWKQREAERLLERLVEHQGTGVWR